MSEKNENLKTIQDLLDYKFKVPSYQRGYRWEKTQVKALLNDILEFSNLTQGQGDDFYCLQPLIVKPLNVEKNINLSKIKEQADENGDIEYEKLQILIEKRPKTSEFSVIDGQQRLTTIYLILKELGDEKFTLEYEREIDNSSADKFYISKAVETIKEWFGEDNKEKFKKTLLEKVKVIWYELKENDDEKQAFENVNSGKIPLTNAELIKATLINSKQNEKDKIELVKEWDEMEYYLQNDEVWGFLTTAEAYPTRIELIFEICLNQKHNDDDKYKTFNALKKKYKKEEYKNFWKEVKTTFLTLRYWYEDYEIYHLVGFLIAANLKIESIYKEAKIKTKSGFKVDLKSKIKEKIKKDELEKLEYEKNNQDITNILLLFNIATILNSKSNFTRFSFDKFNKEKWSLEHIHARNSEEINIDGEKNQLAWLIDSLKYMGNLKEFENKSGSEKELLKDIVKDNNDIQEKIRTSIKEYLEETDKNNKNKKFKETMEQIFSFFSGDDKDDENEPINTIGNLALLSARLNSELNNGIFPKKREKIKEMDERGEFIPICTKNVFMKYYSDSTDTAFDRFKWTNDDMKNYHQSIIKTLDKFFGEENE